MSDTRTRKTRWRLVLGKGSEDACGKDCLEGEWAARDQTLGYLYDREYTAGRNVRSRTDKGGLGDSVLTVTEWINHVHDLFPQKTIERIEKDALERYQLDEMLTNPELLKRSEPSEALLKAVLRTKHLMNQDVLAIARDLVRKVVKELLEKLAHEVNTPFSGVRDRRRRSFVHVAKNFDARTTIKRHLKNYDREKKRIMIETPHFFSRVRRHTEKWRIVVLIDQSGSMVDSVIHSALTAAIFVGINSVKTNLIAFDTNVIDLSETISDPVETLMKVQLGGGTDIGRALAYAHTLIDNPRNTIVILISDFYEGAPKKHMVATVKSMVESGVSFLGLAALDYDANPSFDREMAAELVNLGAHVGAMTPGELASWVAEKIR